MLGSLDANEAGRNKYQGIAVALVNICFVPSLATPPTLVLLTCVLCC